MNDRTALLANVLSDPTDDTARLVLADWLEEHGEEPLGRFVRFGVVAARFRGDELIESPDFYAALAEVATVTKSGHPALWVANLGLGPVPLTHGDWGWDNAGDRVTVRVGTARGVFTRGLLAELELPLGEWYAVASAALVTWPVECVRVADVPGLTFTIAPASGGWQMTGRLKLPRRNVPLGGHVLPSAVGPLPVLTDGVADWGADQFFADRAALVEGAARESASIVDDLKDAAGDRWPHPPRRRR